MKTTRAEVVERLAEIRYAHVKEFTTVYDGKAQPLRPKWVKVVLQVVVDSHAEAESVCKRLVEHMDTPPPRFMVLTEQAIGEPKPKAKKKAGRR